MLLKPGESKSFIKEKEANSNKEML